VQNFLGEIEHTTQTLETITTTNFKEETICHTSFSPFLPISNIYENRGKTHTIKIEMERGRKKILHSL
jgi:hypothetical protein